jgi:hypothetical protein
MRPGRFLKIERSILMFRPRFHGPPEKPDRADEILAAVAAAHEPGERVGIKQIARAGRCSPDLAALVRRWARFQDLWPFRDPSPSRPAGKSDPGPRSSRRRKSGGGS